jgi:anti-repressor protein
MKPKAVFADAVIASTNSILIRDYAKLLRQNGIDMGEKKLYAWFREHGYLIKCGSDYNRPTQYSMNAGWFEVTESYYVNPRTGENISTRTTKVTGRGQVFFMNKFLKGR